MNRSGFDPSSGIYHSLRKPVPLPQDDAHVNLPALLLQANVPGHWTAYIDASTGQVVTYEEFRCRVRTVAAGLATFGVRQGDVVFILSPTSIHVPVIILATMLAGGVVTLANPINTALEIAKQMKDSEAKFACTTASLLDKVIGCKLPFILLEEDSTTTAFPPSATSPCISLSLLLQADPAHVPRIPARQQDTAALLYSSGTTGESKGVIITHKNFIALTSLLHAMEGGSLLPDNVYLCLLPMFHVYGLGLFACNLLAMGSSIVIMPKFDMQEMLAAIQRFKITHLPIVPPILLALTNLGIVDKYDLSSVRQVWCGAAPLSKELVTAFRARFPNVPIKQGYGLTESTAIATVSITEEEYEHYDSAGRLAPNTEAKILDIDSGKLLPPNQQGELLLRGPTIMAGYFGNPGATAATIDSQGWLHTGDLCYFDEQGYLYVVDRLKELIKYKGLQVAPAELEAVLLTHPEILDAAVIPVPDEEAGQIPMAYVVRSPESTIKEVEVIGFVQKQVAPYKKIRRVAFVNAIPKSSSGKILRRELINQISSRI